MNLHSYKSPRAIYSVRDNVSRDFGEFQNSAWPRGLNFGSADSGLKNKNVYAESSQHEDTFSFPRTIAFNPSAIYGALTVPSDFKFQLRQSSVRLKSFHNQQQLTLFIRSTKRPAPNKMFMQWWGSV